MRRKRRCLHEQLPAPANKNPHLGLLPGYMRAEAIIGGILQVTLHETGHAVFDIQGIPRLSWESEQSELFG